MLWLDKYERQARLAPGLLMLLPLAVTVTALGFRSVPVVSIAASLVSVAGGPVLLAGTVRGFGLKVQPHMWASWGGSPTMIALRLREDSANEVQRDVWRRSIEQVTGIQLASRRSESARPQAADQKIDAAVGRLRELTRDEQRFALIQAENRAYGFWRNFYAIRTLGRLVALAGILAMTSLVLWRLAGGLHPVVQVASALGLVIDALIMVVWLVLPSADRVRLAADKYACQLLQGTVSLASDASGASSPAQTTVDRSSRITDLPRRRGTPRSRLGTVSRSRGRRLSAR